MEKIERNDIVRFVSGSTILFGRVHSTSMDGFTQTFRMTKGSYCKIVTDDNEVYNVANADVLSIEEKGIGYARGKW